MYTALSAYLFPIRIYEYRKKHYALFLADLCCKPVLHRAKDALAYCPCRHRQCHVPTVHLGLPRFADSLRGIVCPVTWTSMHGNRDLA